MTVVVYMGGPRHGEVEEIEGDWPPPTLQFAGFNAFTMEHYEVVYERRELADTPGRIAYVHRAALQ